MSEHFHKRVEPIGSELEPKKAEYTDDLSASSKVRFDDALEKADPSKVRPKEQEVIAEEVIKSNKPSLLELAGKTTDVSKVPKVTTETIIDQATKLKQNFQTPRAVLLGTDSDRFARLPEGAVSTLSGHVELMDRGLRDAMKEVKGVEVGSAVETGKPPLHRFLNFLTDSDHKLTNVITDVKALGGDEGKLSPAKLMAVQIKLGFVQQELEFFTNVLNKALESTKTIMNVQI